MVLFAYLLIVGLWHEDVSKDLAWLNAHEKAWNMLGISIFVN
jgi:hypothetical protein